MTQPPPPAFVLVGDAIGVPGPGVAGLLASLVPLRAGEEKFPGVHAGRPVPELGYWRRLARGCMVSLDRPRRLRLFGADFGSLWFDSFVETQRRLRRGGDVGEKLSLLVRGLSLCRGVVVVAAMRDGLGTARAEVERVRADLERLGDGSGRGPESVPVGLVLTGGATRPTLGRWGQALGVEAEWRALDVTTLLRRMWPSTSRDPTAGGQ